MYPAGRCWVFSANLSAQKLGEPLLTGRLFTAAGSSSIRNWVLYVLILCCHHPCYPPGTTARADRRANSWCGTPCQIMTLRPEMLFWSPWSQEWWLTVVAFSWNFLTKTSRLTREILSDVCVNDWALWGVQRPSPFASILDNPEDLSQPCSPMGSQKPQGNCVAAQLPLCPALLPLAPHGPVLLYHFLESTSCRWMSESSLRNWTPDKGVLNANSVLMQ